MAVVNVLIAFYSRTGVTEALPRPLPRERSAKAPRFACAARENSSVWR